jgi:peptidoglycan hydrolase-like protein with peptidoglycan-binding domain
MTIRFPLEPRQRGAAVGVLQDVMQQLLARAELLAHDEPTRLELAGALQAERARKTYGPATERLVSAFQSERALRVSGRVDEATARALERSMPDAPPERGAVRTPLGRGSQGSAVGHLHDTLKGLGLSIADAEVERREYGPTTIDAVTSWQRQHELRPTGALDVAALEKLDAEARQIVRVVRGIVTIDDGTPVPNARVVVNDHDFRRVERLGEAVTGDDGSYRVEYTAERFARVERGSADVGVSVFASDQRTPLYTTPIRDLVMNAPVDTVIDVTVATAPGTLPAEFERIASSLTPLVGEVPFAEIAQKAEAIDESTFLARETSIDEARLAHFVVAHRVLALSEIRADYFYALLREDGLFGVAPGRPRAVPIPVGYDTEPRAVLFEAALLDRQTAKAAVDRAVAKRLVHPSVAEEAEAIAERLGRWRDEATAYVNTELPKAVVGVLEDLIAAGKAEQVLALLGSYDFTDLPQLYEPLRNAGVFRSGTEDAAAGRLNLGEIVGFHRDLIDEVTVRFGANTPGDVRNLARLESREWGEMLSRGVARGRRGGGGVDPAVVERQATAIAQRFEMAFPTAAFSAHLGRRKPSKVKNATKIASLLDEHPNFDLGKHRLLPFLKDAGVDVKTMAPDTVRGLEKLQRIFHLTGDYRQTEALVEAGYTAAADVVAAGRTQFVAEARRAGLSGAEADVAFERAQNTNIGAVTVATNLRTLTFPSALEGAAAAAFAAHIDTIVADQPDLKVLFGSNDACTCKHCRSIYGPAAYFADVMRFMRNRLVKDTTLPPAPSTKTAKDVLFSRRPDLGEIDLNCANAEVPVPHIDIVCELLEEAVSPDPGFTFNGAIAPGAASAAFATAVRGAGYQITDQATVYGPYAPNRFIARDLTIVLAVDGPGPNWRVRRLRQTHGTPEERAAAPEYVNDAAYTVLAGGNRAFALPFDLFHAETRAFVSGTGVERAPLMSALAVAGVPSDDAIAAERLGLSDGQRALIFAASGASQPAIWGVPGPTAATTMKTLDVFNSRTGFEFADVDKLLAGVYVRGAADLFIRHNDNTCDLSKKEIINLDDQVLDRMHRVLRLARKTGLKPSDIDRLAAAPKLGAGDLGSAALRALRLITDLATELNVDAGRIITWLDTISIIGSPSPHGLIFQNPAITGALDPGLTPAAIKANEVAETTTPGSGQRLSAVSADLAVALGTSSDDFDALFQRISEAALLGPNPPITFRAIAALYGRVGLARSLHLKIVDLVSLERLSGIDPLASAVSLRAFVDAAGAIQAAGTSIADLAYRLQRRAPNLALLDLADTTVTAILQSIRTGLVAAAAANPSPYDDALTAPEQIVAYETLLQQQPALDAAAIASLLDMVRIEAPTAAHATAAKAVISGPLAALLDVATVNGAIDAVVAAPNSAPTRKAMVRLVMDGLSLAALRAASFDVAVTALITPLKLSAPMSSAILRGARILVAAVATPLVNLLTAGAIANEAVVLSTATTPDLYRAVRRAHAVAGLIAPFEPDADVVTFMFQQAAALGWLPLDATPIEAADPSVAFADWRALSEVFALIAQYPTVTVPGQPDQSVSVTSVMQLAAGPGPGTGPVLDALAILTGWPRPLLGDLDAHFGGLLPPYRTAATWRARGRAIDLVRALGVPLAEALTYTAAVLGAAEKRNARRMMRARYNEADWLNALKNIMDPIREQKRDALVTALLAANPALSSKLDLYDHFLTDTEWSAKMPSSRLVHAHGTVQLFMQRCIAGLEPKATADLDGDIDWVSWDWMRNYRVWEVNRKVFVEAQYYVRPEWRDDKTEPFQKFETAILQNEINDENVNAAYEGYLDDLDQIAFLDVLATCYDFDRSEMHVVGATKGGDPRNYFHRMIQRERVCTPWTKIDLDISGDNLIAFFRNKRLYLAWLTFVEKGNEDQQSTFPQPSGSGPQSMPKAQRRSEIRLAISEYTGKKWLPRRVSQDPLYTPWNQTSLDRDGLFLSVTPDPERFAVDVYFSSKSGLQRIGLFLLTGCKGYPEPEAKGGYAIPLPMFKDTAPRAQRLVEQNQDRDDELALSTVLGGNGFATLFGRTPGIFRVTYPFQASVIDRLLTVLVNLGMRSKYSERLTVLVFGTLMPFFFEDNQRGFMLVPGFYGPIDERTGVRRTVKTFSNVHRLVLDIIALFVQYIRRLAAATTQAERDQVIAELFVDPDFKAIVAAIESYKRTQFGIHVRNFYHPMACRLREKFFQGGVPLLLARATQLEVGPFRFEDATGYAPTPLIVPPYPRDEMEFGRESAYGVYNWELTYHSVHLIATKLIEAERFDEAERWLRYVFDPLGSSNDPAPARYWNMKPFYLRSAAEYGDQLISAIFDRVARDPSGAVETELADAILEWRRNPFKPYLVARSRTVVFQQAIVDLMARVFMGRADSFFRRDQLEDLVMASLDYSRVERLLGPRPKLVPPAVDTPPETYNQLESHLDLFGNALRSIENLLPDISVLPHGGAELPPPPLTLESLYFCIPPSEKLFELWELLEERQFNLRNSRNIDGVERTLSLFAPPLSVEALIRAAAAGLSVSQILSSLSAARPPHRFRVMLRHAMDAADAAAGFSSALEQALANRDVQALARLKTEQEIRLLKEQRVGLTHEIAAASQAIVSMRKTREMQLETQTFFAARPYMNEWEIAATISYGASFALQAVMAIGYAASGGLALIPNFMVGAAGFGGSPTANVQVSGEGFASSARDFVVGAIGALASALDKAGSMLEHQGNYLVRKEDWDHTAKVAQREVEKADIEIAMLTIRETIAKEQLRVHDVRRQQADAEDGFLKTKFTKTELYDRLVQQLRGLSRETFNVAMEAGKAAERCCQFELGVTDSAIRSGIWNDAQRGLLAADTLSADLQRLNGIYLKRNTRERELTKQLSLARLDPIALIELRTTGRCTIQIPEAVFDLEHPGHYFRRIRSLSVTVPCVGGPFSSVPLQLAQTSNRVRVSTARKVGAVTDADAYAEEAAGDTRFHYNVGSVQSISTSQANGDAGLFEADLNDDRYLPFEGSGACGFFTAELPQTLRPFDYGTITDVILTLRYTARDGGGAFKRMVANGLRERMNTMVLKAGRVGLFHAFDLRRDRPNVFQQLTSTGGSSFAITQNDLPYFTTGRAAGISSTRILARVQGGPASLAGVTVGGASVTLNAAPEPDLAGLLTASVAGLSLGTSTTITVPMPNQIQELLVVANYSMTS